ncbi:MAG: ASPIC/UnbV domain-containing protein [Saprospiraceae bacterium]
MQRHDRNFLYKNDGTEFSRDLESIDNLETPCSYGAAWGDVNNDGFLDLLIATCKNNTGAPLSKNLFYQNLGNANNWIKIKPIGTQANRSGIGAKVYVKAIINGVEKIQMREISAQSGYCGQNSLYAHFGLGEAVQVLEVRVQFSCGSEVILTNISANQLIEITETEANPVAEILPENKLSVKINPNPASGPFIISVQVKDYLKNVELNLIDTTGRIVWRDNFVNIQAGIFEKTIYPKNMGLNPGVYILKIIGDGFVKSEMVTIN